MIAVTNVALRRRVVAGDEADQSRDPRQRPLPLGREQAFLCELRLQPLELGKVGAKAVPLDRERAQMEVAALLVQLRAPEDVDALAVHELEPEGVELAAVHLHGQAGPALGILQREENERPALLAAQLGHLALDPQRREPPEPRGDPLVERADRKDLAAVNDRRVDLHRPIVVAAPSASF